MACYLVICSYVLSCCAAVRFDGNDFVDEEVLGNVLGKAEVDKTLLHELTGDFRPSGVDHTDHRIERLQALLLPMYTALPKDAGGKLGHNVVRYALHRLLVQYHGWYIKGLEPRGSSARGGGASSEPIIMAGGTNESEVTEGWVPEYLQWTLEEKMGGGGLSHREMAVVAATLEDLASNEAVTLLKSVYKFWEVDPAGHLDSHKGDDILLSHMLSFLSLRFQMSKEHQKMRDRYVRAFRKEYLGCGDLEKFIAKVRADVVPDEKARGWLDFENVTRIVVEASKRYAVEINDMECRNLKHFMMSLEGPRPGRVELPDFYKSTGFNAARWVFDEKREYLRAAGTLDESEKDKPSVIIANYVSSKPQCLEVSRLFGLCCRNECEDLLGHVEQEIKADTATPEAIAAIVEKLPSDSVVAPRTLSATLRSRLDQVAAANAGRVPLHGRLFAQWMHHAFPHECPFPHQAGTTNPLSPDDWMTESGQSAYASKEEIASSISVLTVSADGSFISHVGRGSGAAAGKVAKGHIVVDAEAKLPWIDAEELLEELPSALRPAAEVAASMDGDETKLKSLNEMVGTLLHGGSDVKRHDPSTASAKVVQLVDV